MKALVFSRLNCTPCKKYQPEVEYLINMGYNIEIIKLEDQPMSKETYNLKAAPTTIIFDGDKEVQRFTGSKTRSELKRILDKE